MEIQNKLQILQAKIFGVISMNLRRTRTMNENLKPCPFCGGKVTIAEMGNDEYGHYIVTKGFDDNKCTCRMFMESGQFEKSDKEEYKAMVREDLIKKWNRRECQCRKEN